MLRYFARSIVWGFGSQLGREAARGALDEAEATLARAEDRRTREREARLERERQAREELERLKAERDCPWWRVW